MDIHPTAVVHQSAQLGEGVSIGPFAVIGPEVVIGPRTKVDQHVSIDRQTTVGADCHIWPFASVGTDPQDLKFGGEDTYLEIGDQVMIREFVTVNRGTGEGGGVTRVGDRCLLMAYAHVAHDCQLGIEVIMANCCNLAGHVHLENYVGLGGMVAIHQFTRVGAHTFVGGTSAVAKDLPPYTLCEGNRAKPLGLNMVGLKRRGFTPETLETLKKAYKIIFRTRTPIKQAMAQVRDEVPDLPEVRYFLEFIESSTRGVAR
ncbi:MAG: acyl-ACP--UDP-N-acetylglucosamine O-acyltransferase [Desulfarculaceae bacterium]|nr:acyl-ACP--UDP-N-acetylglucosamine O-acyltransferase [Desulfarculaceae bacterium]MCF8072242.1 acyl-ACP--UDP-N-acetylglucosamine O-acyltransferase [Desulfarculaceae bacterium]MCF8100163.1 acyl-ACP--UDP-N-acetylglucosamine O-acyltransferase [Desulfarculaceae bacterium]MCF8117894.1 acyl-ACP--UDP-N-acetylglucosamine O-acyltransferase [Desulfarculaceae bacterium]